MLETETTEHLSNPLLHDLSELEDSGKARMYTSDAINALLKEGHFGIESVEIYRAVINDPEILDLMEAILSRTYKRFLGDDGAKFLKTYFQEIRSLPKSSSFDTIEQSILKLRDIFQRSALCDRYHGPFRNLNLKTSVRIAGPDFLSGTVVDVGANDNVLGLMILELCPAVSCVIGVDIGERKSVRKSKKLEFRVQTSSIELPAADNEADTVVSRYSFHHMKPEEQLSIRDEITRILKPGGTFIIYENGYSFNLEPIASDKHGLHSKMLSLGDPVRLRLFLAALDVFSHGIKTKNMPFPYTYKTIEEWEEFFKAGGLIPVETRYYGIPIYDLHQQPLGVFILRNSKSGRLCLSTL